MRRGMGEAREEVVAVAIDKDKSSQYALKWTVDHLITKGQSITLLHVNTKPSSVPSPFGSFVSMHEVSEEVARTYKLQLENQAKDLFLPFRCFCNRKDIKCNEVIIDETDIARTLLNYVASNSIETLVLGAASRNGIVKRFKTTDVPSSVSKAAPDFCTVYVISKGKISSVRSASSKIPSRIPAAAGPTPSRLSSRAPIPMPILPPPHRVPDEIEMRSPFTRGGRNRSYELSPDSDISYVSSSSADRMSPDYDPLRISDLSASSFDYSPSHSMDEAEAEMKRLRMELRHTMDMYSTACREALSAKKTAMDLHRWKLEEEHKLEEAKLSEEAALALADKEKAKCRAALEAAEAARRLAELESQKRIHAELKAAQEKKGSSNFAEIRYRRYSIEEIESATEDFAESRKIGEGGYGPVFRGELDHTPVAIKVLRPDAAQGRSQFQQEVEVLSCIRHPNMVLLLGACPQFGCLVYEYMANGSLDDRLFRRGNSPVLPWRLRFRIAAEIGTALLFLHGTKPEPLVHRDLKPANILLDRNFVSKISDVGLARLVPPSVADSVTQYRMTATAGTFCYIDPEYQQTGMLGIKSDIYSLGVLLLQMITAKPPMGLAHHVSRAIDRGTFAEMLDPAVPDWPLQQTLDFAKLALTCAEMRRKDRPDLGKVILPQLNRLRELADETTPPQFPSSSSSASSSSSSQEVISDLQQPSGYENSSSTASS